MRGICTENQYRTVTGNIVNYPVKDAMNHNKGSGEGSNRAMDRVGKLSR